MKKVLTLLIGMVFTCNSLATGSQKKAEESISQPAPIIDLYQKPVKQPEPPRPKTVTRCCSIEPFDSLVVGGHARVKLTNGPYNISITGPDFIPDCPKMKCPKITENTLTIGHLSYKYTERKVSEVLTKIKNTLSIKHLTEEKIPDCEKEEDRKMLVTISVPKLENITVVDNALVTSQNFNVSNFNITAKDSGGLDLDGELNIKNISQYGTGQINIDWVKSESLAIKGNGIGPIYLSGETDNLTAKLTGNTRLYARHLRTQKAWIFASDNAAAEILPIENLYAYADTSSNIYYFKRPANDTIVTRDSGNVLCMHY
jgi:hypothetical protein